MAAKIADLDHHISRKLRLKDLRVFVNVVEQGSMAKAGVQLRVSQSAVSQVVAELERTLGVRLFDRSSRGVVLTPYGEALLRSSRAAFQDLKEGIQELGFLADPTAGELRIGCNIAITHTLLSGAIERFAERYPKVVLQISEIATPTDDYPQLREHKLDLVLIRLTSARRESDFSYEFGFDREEEDRFVAAVGRRSPLARRRQLDLTDLAAASWTTTPPGTNAYAAVAEAFAARGLPMPHVAVPTFSIPLRASLAATGRFIAVFHATVMRFEAKRYELKELPVQLMSKPWPFAVVTLKNRTLSPLARRFVGSLREVGQTRTLRS